MMFLSKVNQNREKKEKNNSDENGTDMKTVLSST